MVCPSAEKLHDRIAQVERSFSKNCFNCAALVCIGVTVSVSVSRMSTTRELEIGTPNAIERPFSAYCEGLSTGGAAVLMRRSILLDCKSHTCKSTSVRVNNLVELL